MSERASPQSRLSPRVSPSSRWGFSYPLDGIPLAEHRTVLETAEAHGYTDAWTPEVAGADSLLPLGLASAWTSHLRLGTAIANIFTRGPAILAMTAAAAAEAAPRRFCLGVGVGSHTTVETWNGLKLEKPLRRLRETVGFLRSALAGERVSNEYLRVDSFRLSRSFGGVPPIFIAGLREKMLALGGELAEGILINYLAPRDVPKVVSIAKEAARAVGRDPEALEVVCVLAVFAGPREDESRLQVRRMAAAYLSTPVYNAYQNWLGRGDALREMTRAWNSGQRAEAYDLVPDEIIEDLHVIGDPAHCRRRIEEYCNSGVTVPVLNFKSTAREPAEVARETFEMLKAMAPRR